MRQGLLWALLPALFIAAGCATSLQNARRDFYSGDLNRAAEALPGPGSVSGRDRLLYFMEKGVILYQAGRYDESIHTLLQASDLMRQQEPISASRQATSLITSERITEYKGEYAERLWVHTYLMMNYLLVGNAEDALVEAKQALEVFHQYPEALSRAYFTRALIAHCYEAMGQFNDAYIEYVKLAQSLPDPSPVAEKVYFLGRRLGFTDDIEPYRKYVKDPEADPENGSAGELIIFVAQGRAPEKIPHNIVLPPSIRFSFVAYRDRTGPFYRPAVRIPREPGGTTLVTTDVGSVLKDSLHQRMLKMITKETARVAAKEAISRQINDPLVEALVRISFFLMEEPDTRGWETLPAYLSMIRVPLPAGVHRVAVSVSGSTVLTPEFNVRPGGRYYYYYAVRDGYLSRLEP